jgi:hypothetical protein
LRRAEGGAKIVGVFRVKNHDFKPKNHIFSNFRGDARRVLPPPPPWIRPSMLQIVSKKYKPPIKGSSSGSGGNELSEMRYNVRSLGSLTLWFLIILFYYY